MGVATIKEISLEISKEVAASCKIVENLDTNFGQTQRLLNNTNARLQQMTSHPGTRYMCYLVLFIVGLFLILSFLHSMWYHSSLETSNLKVDTASFLLPSSDTLETDATS